MVDLVLPMLNLDTLLLAITCPELPASKVTPASVALSVAGSSQRDWGPFLTDYILSSLLALTSVATPCCAVKNIELLISFSDQNLETSL